MLIRLSRQGYKLAAFASDLTPMQSNFLIIAEEFEKGKILTSKREEQEILARINAANQAIKRKRYEELGV